MKKISVALFMIFAVIFAQAQVESEQTHYTLNNEYDNSLIEKSTILNINIVGTVIWSEDFSNDNWSSTVYEQGKGGFLNNGTTLPDKWFLIDNTAEGNLKSKWHWSDVGARGLYTTDSDDWEVPDSRMMDTAIWPEKATIDNGFMILEPDYFNTTDAGEKPTESIELESYLFYGPIDLSNAEGVVLYFNALYRLCCSGASSFNLEVSNNYSPDEETGTWVSFRINDSIPLSGGSTGYEDIAKEINISSVAKNQASVYLRFVTNNVTEYFVIIDDIMLVEPLANNLVLERGWAEYTSIPASDDEDFYKGGFTAIPVNTAGVFEQFKAKVSNSGTAIADSVKLVIEILKDGIVQDVLYSKTKNINSGLTDDLVIISNFSPAEIGFYQLSMTVIDENIVDDFPENNNWYYEFNTTPNTYSRVRHGKEDEFEDVAAAQWNWGGTYPTDGDVMAVNYLLDDNVQAEFSGANVYVYPTTDSAELYAIAKGQYKMKACAYKTNFETGELEKLNLVSEIYTVRTSDLGRWVYLPYVDNGELLQAKGEYYIGFEFYTGTEGEDILKFRIGNDVDGLEQPKYNNLVYLNALGGWGNVGNTQNFAIDLMVNYTPPSMVTLTFNYDMQHEIIEPSDVICVKGDFIGDSIMLAYDAATKEAVGSVSYESSVAATVINYEAYINSVAEGVKRNTKISDADVTVSHTYGWPTKVLYYELQNVSVYPNPTNDKIFISTEYFECSTFKIEIFDMSGKLMGSKMVNNYNLKLPYFINISEFGINENGVYLLQVSSKTKVDNTKVLYVR